MFDQGREYLAVKKIVIDHKLTLIGPELGSGAAGFSGVFQGPVFYYLLAIPLFLFQGDPYGSIILMFFFGLLTIGFSFYLGNKTFGKWGGLVLSLLVALSPPLVAQSRLLWAPHLVSLFVLITFYYVYLIPKNTKYIFLAAFFSAFVYNFELAIAVPLSLVLLLYSVIVLRFANFKKYIFLFSGYALGLLPMFLFEIRHSFMGIKGTFIYSFQHSETDVTLKFIELITKDHFKSFIFNFLDTFPRQNIIPPLFIFLAVFAPVIYFVLKEKHKDLKHFIIFLILLPPISFFVLNFIRSGIFPHYLAHLNLVYILLFVYVALKIFEQKSLFLKILLSVFILIHLINAIPNSIQTFIADLKDYGGTAKNKGKIDAIDYIYKDSKGKEFGLLVFSPPIYTYPYDYLIQWYAQKKYGYVPHKEKKGLFYLLIEKDGEKPWSHNGWLETVIKTGKILETKTLPSGFIVQKRVEE